MALTTLQISVGYEPAFLKNLAGIDGSDAWGTSPSDVAGTQTIIFDDAFTEAVVAAVNGYDAAWLLHAKDRRIEQVAAMRRAVIADTFTFNGIPMRLDPDTENALSKGYSALQRQPVGTSIDWEISRGQFASFDLEALGAISDAAFLHVQAAFTNARSLTVAINSAVDLATLDAVDLSLGWGD